MLSFPRVILITHALAFLLLGYANLSNNGVKVDFMHPNAVNQVPGASQPSSYKSGEDVESLNKSLSVAWLTMASLCFTGLLNGAVSQIWHTLIVFHITNSCYIFSTGQGTLDSMVTLLILVLTIYAFRTTMRSESIRKTS